MSALEPTALSSAPPRVTVWYDGACPLCLKEIALFRRLDRRRRIAFVDVSDPNAEAFCPLDRGELLARFHAQEQGRPIVSGAAAFAAMWRATPLLGWLGHLAQAPPLLWGLERLYVAFLRVRPRMQAWFTAKTHS